METSCYKALTGVPQLLEKSGQNWAVYFLSRQSLMFCWPKTSRVVLFAGLLLGPLGGVHAATGQELPIQLAQLGLLPPEQRQQMREQMREHWQQLPSEERQAQRERFREERRERREAHQLLPPEDRSRMRDELRGWRNGEGERGFGRRHGHP